MGSSSCRVATTTVRPQAGSVPTEALGPFGVPFPLPTPEMWPFLDVLLHGAAQCVVFCVWPPSLSIHSFTPR